MTITVNPELKATSDLAQRAKSLVPLLDQHAQWTDEHGRLHDDVVDAFHREGMFLMWVPKELGGFELNPVESLDVLALSSYADSSAGWVQMAACLSIGTGAAYLGDRAVAELFHDGKYPVIAGQGTRPGSAVTVDGVTRVPGRLITTASADVALKGLAYLLEAMAKLRADGLPITLTIIGRPKPGRSMDLIDQYGLAEHIQFVSGVSDERIVELYAEAELAVVPSLYEGFSLPAIEAMCTGTPLVATDGGALPEVTGADGDTVFRARKGDAGDLARVIRAALCDTEGRARVGANGRRRVLERWTWKRCAEQTVEQYREVLSMPANIAKLRRNGRLAN